jgi:hypothetical protein
MDIKRVGILGHGYCGAHLAQALQNHPEFECGFATKRHLESLLQGDSDLPSIGVPELFPLDMMSLSAQRQWQDLPNWDLLLITLPLDAISNAFWPIFVESISASGKPVIALGTIGAYAEFEMVHNESDLNSNLRTLREKDFCQAGGSVLRLSGIWGQGRDPLDWLNKGLIPASRQHVNLVHVQDIASACLRLAADYRPGVAEILSAESVSWEKVIALQKTLGHLPEDFDRPAEGGRGRPQRTLDYQSFDKGPWGTWRRTALKYLESFGS